MASDRQTAKGAVVEKQTVDAELDAALAKAARHQLDLKKEENRHKEVINRQNLGIVGNLFGDGKSLPTTAALLTVIFGFLTAIGLYLAAFSRPESAELWTSNAERALSVAIAALAYVFGKGTR